MHEPTISNKKNICYNTEARYVQTFSYDYGSDSYDYGSDDNSDEELNTRIGNTNWCIRGNFSKMETSTKTLCCCEMLEISDE